MQAAGIDISMWNISVCCFQCSGNYEGKSYVVFVFSLYEIFDVAILESVQPTLKFYKRKNKIKMSPANHFLIEDVAELRCQASFTLHENPAPLSRIRIYRDSSKFGKPPL